jgi:hypothetical protein
VRFVSTFTKKVVKRKKVSVPTGFIVTMTLAAAPSDPEIFYRISAAAGSCTQLFLEYGTDVATKGTAVRCPGLPPAKDVSYNVPDVKVQGNTITWTVPSSQIPAGTTLSSINAQTRVNPAVVTAPQIDVATTAKTFTVGK